MLYRKYRPQGFSEFIGQENIVKTLANAIASEMVSHAYLFSGPRGSGKTSLARIFARAVNCQNRKKGKFEPCNACPSCLEMIKDRSMDLTEIDAASHRGIDDIKELKEGIRFAPARSKYKIFILDEAHQLSKDADNALLKTLEEPPSHVIFILATTEIHKMLPTIVSRCQRFDFRKLTSREIIKKLTFICQKEKIRIEKQALKLIALHSEGSLRDAEGLLGQVFSLYGDREIHLADVKDILGLVEMETAAALCDFLLQRNPAGAINFINELFQKGADLGEFSKALINYLRQALVLKIMGKANNPFVLELTKEELDKLESQSKRFTQEQLKKILNLFLEAQNKMRYSPIPQLPLELAIVESCGVACLRRQV